MQPIKIYMNKIEDVLSKRSSGKTSTSGKKGLLAPSKAPQSMDKTERQQIDVIADIIEGIREAREEILNAKA